jgi:ribosomal protein S18 acetylase RimI-like enzyme
VSVRIRTAVERDADAIVRLIGELRAAEGITPQLDPSAAASYLADPATIILLAEEAGDACGLVSVRVIGDLFHGAKTALVQELVVGEQSRGRRIGGALLDAAVEHACTHGCVEIGVTTGVSNEAGQALYRSRGFEVEGSYFEKHLD